MKNESEAAHWQIDRRIPIALLITLFFQFASALVWATQLNARVGTLEQDGVGMADFGEKLARIDERLQGMKQDVEFIKNEVGGVRSRFFK
jgi:hypothetical protein